MIDIHQYAGVGAEDAQATEDQHHRQPVWPGSLQSPQGAAYPAQVDAGEGARHYHTHSRYQLDAEFQPIGHEDKIWAFHGMVSAGFSDEEKFFTTP